IEGAIVGVRQRAGHSLDPQICARFCELADHLLGGLDDDASWEVVLAAEPGPRPYLSEEALDNAALVLADFIDLLAPYFVGHSRAVAALAAQAGRHYGLPDSD